MLATVAATLGLNFAIGKTVAAFGLGIVGGMFRSLLASLVQLSRSFHEKNLVGSIMAHEFI